MSADADRIPRCTRCGKRRGDAVATKCNRDGVGCDFEGGRIAALEAELAEARKQQRLGWDRAAEKDRAYGAALAERDADRAAHERTKAELAEWKLRAEVAERQWNRVLDVEAERDAAQAREQAACALLADAEEKLDIVNSRNDELDGAVDAAQAEAAELRHIATESHEQWTKLVADVETRWHAAIAEVEALRDRRIKNLEREIHALGRVAEIFTQLQSSFIHGEHGTASKLMTALGIALAALGKKGDV